MEKCEAKWGNMEIYSCIHYFLTYYLVLTCIIDVPLFPVVIVNDL